MKHILVHRYRYAAAALSATLLAVSSAALHAAVGDSPAAMLATPMELALSGDDGKDVKETKEVTPPEPNSPFHVLFNLEVADKYVTPRGMIVRDRGVTLQPLVLVFLNLYKSEGFFNDVTLVGGVWNDFGTSLVSTHAPGGTYPKTSFSETDPIAGVAITFAKRFKLEVTYTAFVEHILDIGTSHNLETKLTFDDSDYLKAFAIHPYVSYWMELEGKGTDADVPYTVFGPSAASGSHPDPGPSFYFELGIDPSYTFTNFGSLKFEAPCRLMIADNRFYGEYYKSSPTLGVGVWELGLKASVPLKFMPKQMGSWSIHAGFRYMNFPNDNLYQLNDFNDPGQPTRDTWQAYGGISVFF